jgi:hypothetical protein
MSAPAPALIIPPPPPSPDRIRSALRSVEAEEANAVDVVTDDGTVLGRWGSWEWPGMVPGNVARLRRMEALERAERAAEAQERADERLASWALRRMREKASMGEWYDPADWLAQSSEQLDEKVFRAQDAEDRRAYVVARVRSGEWKLLGPLEPTPSSPPTASDSASAAAPGSASRSASSMTPARAKLVDRLVEWRHGKEHEGRPFPCSCSSCVRVRVARQGKS